ncbi:MAG: glycosyltransferase family 39 protein, partial [Anaerolineae bacterium]|nr:glycosyltransferase family 39 protein [Anaerolineae bacterium]
MLSTRLPHISWPVLLFLLFFSLYVFTMSGAIHYGDEMEKYRVAQSIVERGDFTFRPTAQRNVIGIRGRTVSGYELGQTLVEVPFYVLGKLAYTIFPVADSNWLTMLWVGLSNPVIMALVVVLFFKTARLLNFHPTIAVGLALVLGLSTIVFPYSRSFTREPLLTLLLLLALFTSLQFSKTFSRRWLLLTGLTLGYLVFTKFIHGVVIPIFLLYIIIVIFQHERQRNANSAQTWLAIARGVLVVISPGILFLVAQMLYAFARFGNFTSGLGGLPSNPIDAIIRLLPFATPWEATLGLLFSPDKSIFLYSPPAILGLVGWYCWLRVQARDALFILALVLVEFVPVTWRWDWAGGTWWGPRYLVQITPLLILPIGFLFDAKRAAQNKKWTLLLGGLAAIGFPIQTVGAIVNDRDYMDATGWGSTLWGQIEFVARGAIDSLVIYLVPNGFPFHINPFGILLIIVILFLAGLFVTRWRQNDTLQSLQVNGLFLT